jgi:rhodanese-related sulfurtransferase
MIKEINITEANKLLFNNKNIILIDVRETEEWEEGRIPGAIHISKNIIEHHIQKHVPNKNTQLILLNYWIANLKYLY